MYIFISSSSLYLFIIHPSNLFCPLSIYPISFCHINSIIISLSFHNIIQPASSFSFYPSIISCPTWRNISFIFLIIQWRCWTFPAVQTRFHCGRWFTKRNHTIWTNLVFVRRVLKHTGWNSRRGLDIIQVGYMSTCSTFTMSKCS